MDLSLVQSVPWHILLSVSVLSVAFVPWLIFQLLQKRATMPNQSIDGLIEKLPVHSVQFMHERNGDMFGIQIKQEGNPIFIFYAFPFPKPDDGSRSVDILLIRRDRKFFPLCSQNILRAAIEEGFGGKRFILSPVKICGREVKATRISASDWDAILKIHDMARKIVTPYFYDVVLRKQPRE